MVIGMLIVILQPFKSSKVNIYHTLLPFFMAICCFSITTVIQAESKAYWMIRPDMSSWDYLHVTHTGHNGLCCMQILSQVLNTLVESLSKKSRAGEFSDWEQK